MSEDAKETLVRYLHAQRDALRWKGSSRFVVNGPAGKVFTRRFSLRL